jgi:hypothetical protein
MTSKGIRIALVALEVFLVLTCLTGAIFVIPAQPISWLKHGPFADYTIPALALGSLCGGSALVAAVAVITQHPSGALASILAGLMMIGFEFVEIAVVGLTALETPKDPVGWLQVFFIGIGTAVAVLGAKLYRAEADARVMRGTQSLLRPAH